MNNLVLVRRVINNGVSTIMQYPLAARNVITAIMESNRIALCGGSTEDGRLSIVNANTQRVYATFQGKKVPTACVGNISTTPCSSWYDMSGRTKRDNWEIKVKIL